MYQVLARKYRPRNFSQLIGQDHVAQALTNALTRGRLHHAYLFTGTRGVGKTTIARIVAKCLNCETGITATPCERCDVCKAVNAGRFIDLIEIDAASRTRVEDTRELLDNVPYAPTQGRYKVYLIDEVHMLSTHSFNALLKTLEEPPEHVKFLFATTDPQKLPITVISRCLQFSLRPVTKAELAQHLATVLTAEQVNFEDAALWQLAESAQGSVRDALSLTDQAIAYGQGQIRAEDVQSMLGLLDKQIIFDLLTAIYEGKTAQVAYLLQTMRHQAVDVVGILEQLISILHDIALVQCLGHQAFSDQCASAHHDTMQQQQILAQQLLAQDVQLYYQIAIQGRKDLSLALTPEQGFEMCILRLLAFRPLQPNEYMQENRQCPQKPSPQISPQPALSPQPTILSLAPQPTLHEVQKKIEPKLTQPQERRSNILETDITQTIMPIEKSVEKPAFIQNTKNMPADPRDALKPADQSLTGQWTVEKWDYWLASAQLSHIALNIAQNSVMTGEIGGQGRLLVDTSQSSFKGIELTLKQALANIMPHYEVIFQSLAEMQTPKQYQQQRHEYAKQYAIDKISKQPQIQILLSEFSGTIHQLTLKT